MYKHLISVYIHLVLRRFKTYFFQKHKSIHLFNNHLQIMDNVMANYYKSIRIFVHIIILIINLDL
jgi:hypothetical protein